MLLGRQCHQVLAGRERKWGWDRVDELQINQRKKPLDIQAYQWIKWHPILRSHVIDGVLHRFVSREFLIMSRYCKKYIKQTVETMARLVGRSSASKHVYRWSSIHCTSRSWDTMNISNGTQAIRSLCTRCTWRPDAKLLKSRTYYVRPYNICTNLKQSLPIEIS